MMGDLLILALLPVVALLILALLLGSFVAGVCGLYVAVVRCVLNCGRVAT